MRKPKAIKIDIKDTKEVPYVALSIGLQAIAKDMGYKPDQNVTTGICPITRQTIIFAPDWIDEKSLDGMDVISFHQVPINLLPPDQQIDAQKMGWKTTAKIAFDSKTGKCKLFPPT